MNAPEEYPPPSMGEGAGGGEPIGVIFEVVIGKRV
jgi:hypothetical protein